MGEDATGLAFVGRLTAMAVLRRQYVSSTDRIPLCVVFKMTEVWVC